MQFKTYLQSKLPFFVALSLLFVLASCGSYQYVGSDNDGIYNSSVEIPVEETRYVETQSSNNAYYKDLFAEKSKQFESISQDDNVIFTDIDSYEGNYSDENVTAEAVYEDGYAGWGQDNQNVNIHVYNNNAWGWNTVGWGVGLGWYRPWGWGNNWGWNNWGYGGFYDPFWPNYGYGFYGPAYGGFYGHGGFYGNYYNRNQVSYNSGRRGAVNSYNANNNSNLSRRSNSSINSSNRNSTITRRNNTGTRNSTLNTNTTRRNNTINSTPTRRNNSINNSTPTRRSSTTTRSSTPTRSSGGTMSSGSSRSSSSGGGGRSSGGGGRRGG